MTASSAGAVIETDGLTKRFGALTAVAGLGLEVSVGEVFGFLGPNGAGKTTTIRMLLDFLRPTSGSLRVLGGHPSDPAVRGRVGYLPADLRLPPRYTTHDLVRFFGGLRGGAHRDGARVDGLLERFDLDPGRRVGELSTGNRRKVGIVLAFFHRPELLILDEPTSGLDPLLQEAFHDLVRRAVTSEGATVLLSSHLLPEVELLADRVGILRAGQLVRTARPDELRHGSRQHLRLTLDAPADVTSTFAGVAGVVSVRSHGRTVDVVVQGSVDAVIKAAATLAVVGIAADEDDFKDTFLGLYGGDAGAGDGSDGAVRS